MSRIPAERRQACSASGGRGWEGLYSGAHITVDLLQVDLERRRIELALAGANASSSSGCGISGSNGNGIGCGGRSSDISGGGRRVGSSSGGTSKRPRLPSKTLEARVKREKSR